MSSSDDSNASESEQEQATGGGGGPTPDFIAAQCLFCDVRSADVDASLVHMASTHSFVVPHQASLVVDVPTLVWYLHLVVYQYHECIACGSRRRSTAAAQHHMQSKGHCRFDVANEEMADFYDLSTLDNRLVSALTRTPDEGTVRLASGKLISQRGAPGAQSSGGRPSQASSSSRSSSNNRRRLEQPRQRTDTQRTVRDGEESDQQIVLDKGERRLAAAARQMTQLSVRDQQALAHLAPHEQRKELALRKKQVDQARRAEWRARTAVGRKGNKTLMANYKPQGPERANG